MLGYHQLLSPRGSQSKQFASPREFNFCNFRAKYSRMDHEFVLKARQQRPNIRDVYELNEDLQIGRGSYGVVYKIHRKNETAANRKYYALKVIELLPYSPSACREISVNQFASLICFYYSYMYYYSEDVS